MVRFLKRGRGSWQGALAILVGLLLAGAAAQADDFGQGSRIACHNCYEPGLAKNLAEALDQVQAIEIDFWPDNGWWGSKDGDFFVRHGGINLEFGNVSNCSGEGFLSDCLKDLAAWSDAHPGHPPVALFLDIKQVKPSWLGKAFEPEVLDKLVVDQLGAARLVRPQDLQGDANSIRARLLSAGWPKSEDLQGKFVPILTGGYQFDRTGTMLSYLAQRGRDATAFVTADVTSSADVAAINPALRESLAFVNIKGPKMLDDLPPLLAKEPWRARVWSSEPDAANYVERMKGAAINFIALYNFRERFGL